MSNPITVYITLPTWADPLVQQAGWSDRYRNHDGTTLYEEYECAAPQADIEPVLEAYKIGYDKSWRIGEHLAGQAWVRYDEQGERQVVEINEAMKSALADQLIDYYLEATVQGHRGETQALDMGYMARQFMQENRIQPVTVDIRDIQPTEAQRQAIARRQAR